MNTETQTAIALDDDTHVRISSVCSEGDRLAEAGDNKAAIQRYNDAWRMIPEPKRNWNASTWILTAITDAAFLGGYRQSAREAVDFLMSCPGAVGNPFIHLRRGQILLDAGEHDAAADELTRAYMGGGVDIFAKDDGRYLEFLKTRIQL